MFSLDDSDDESDEEDTEMDGPNLPTLIVDLAKPETSNFERLLYFVSYLPNLLIDESSLPSLVDLGFILKA